VSKTTAERLAVLEARLEYHEEECSDRDKDLAQVLSKLEKIDKELSRYRGFVGGILLVVTALVTFVKIFGAGIANYFSK